MKSDIEIALDAKMRPIWDIAKEYGFEEDEIELYGNYKAKINLSILERLKDRPNGKYVLVTAITPTPLGEGKTTTTVGLGQAFNKIGKKGFICIRQPSLGPVFGIKGGAAGGGYAQVVPMEEFNLHLTGDTHAVTTAHNLLSAHIDTQILLNNPYNIDPLNVTWRRVIDISDRALRQVMVGLGGKANGVPRETGFDITVASEIMAVLALSKNIEDLKERFSKMLVAYTNDGKPVTCGDMRAHGAMSVIMKDAIKPNLMQTLENTPAFVHAGPFANIAHGNSSVLADMIACKVADVVVTEGGFGSDMGAEKFFNIKSRVSGLKPDCAVIVTSIRGLKLHGGAFMMVPGRKVDPEVISAVNMPALEKGVENLQKHVEIVKMHGVPAVVCVNVFPTDTPDEIELVRKIALETGASDVVVSEVFAKGGEGGIDLANSVWNVMEKEESKFDFLYPLDMGIKEKIEAIATKVYGADGVDYLAKAENDIKTYTDLGYDKLPICMAKTHLSLSHDPNLKGRPKGFRVPIREVRPSFGAGFLYPLLGEMRTMPGLPSQPNIYKVDFDENGRIVGLF